MYRYRTDFSLTAKVKNKSEAQDFFDDYQIKDIFKNEQPIIGEKVIDMDWLLWNKEEGRILIDTRERLSDEEIKILNDFISNQMEGDMNEEFSEQNFANYEYDDEYFVSEFDNSEEYSLELVSEAY